MARLKLGVLISGRGSNLQALIDATTAPSFPAEIALVISNRADTGGLARAEAAGIATKVIPHKEFVNREAFDAALDAALRQAGVGLVCLAGFMRLLTPEFCRAFPLRALNIHPSLLPAFPGIDAQKQALEHGVKISGCTVHFVEEELDGGPIILQAAVPVLDDDTEQTLAARILIEEHRIYSAAIGIILSGRWRMEGRHVIAG